MENLLLQIFAKSDPVEIILIIAGFIYLRNYFNNKFDKLENKFEKLENKFEKLVAEFEKLENEFTKLVSDQKEQFKYLNTRIDNLYQLFMSALNNRGKDAA